MATLKEPFALDRSLNTTEVTPRNIADVLAEELSRITGRNASQVEYDNTESGLDADNVQDALDEIVEDIPTVPSVDIQTAVDEFETYNGGLLSECKVTLEPVQDLHGYPEPWVGGAGKNLYKMRTTSITQDGITVTANADGTLDISGTSTRSTQIVLCDNLAELATKLNNGGTFSLSLHNATYNSNTFNVSITYTQNGTTKWITPNNSVTVESGNYTVNSTLYVASGVTVSTVQNFVIQLEKSSSPTDFAPYSNICPITGHTQVEMRDDGKNCLPNDATDQTVSGVAFKKNNNGSLTLNGQSTADWAGITLTSAKTLKAGTYTVSCPRVNSVDTRLIISYDGAEKVNTYNVDYKTFTLSEDKTISVRFVIRNSGVSFSNVTYYPMIEKGSIKTDYVPYNGYQITINLGGTYYSGTLDVVSGVLTVDKVKAVTPTRGSLDSSGKLYAISFSGGTIHNYTDTLIATPYVVCSHLDVDSLAGARDTQRKCICQYAGVVYIGGYVGEETALDNMLPSADFSIVFELATPLTIQLSPTMVKALVGENHLAAPLDGQEITESKYKQAFTFDDVIAYIQSL